MQMLGRFSHTDIDADFSADLDVDFMIFGKEIARRAAKKFPTNPPKPLPGFLAMQSSVAIQTLVMGASRFDCLSSPLSCNTRHLLRQVQHIGVENLKMRERERECPEKAEIWQLGASAAWIPHHKACSFSLIPEVMLSFRGPHPKKRNNSVGATGSDISGSQSRQLLQVRIPPKS